MRAILILTTLLVLVQGNERINRTIQLLEEGATVFGILGQNHSIGGAQSVADSDLDMVFVDMEHNPFNIDRLQVYLLAMVRSGEALRKGFVQPNVTAMVRLPANGGEQNQYVIKQALDLGMMGLMIPMVESGEDALAAVRSARSPQQRGVADFEPTGARGAFPDKGARYWSMSPAEYAARADLWPLDPDGEILLVLEIESVRGVENIDEILSVPGIGAAFVGPGDLAMSIGVPGAEGEQIMEEYIQTVLDACKSRNVVPGIFAGANVIARRVEQGFRLLVFGDGDYGTDVSSALNRGRTAAGRQ